MSGLPPVKVWIENGQLLTNRPDVFSRQFEMPQAASVDGLSRVSHKTKDIFGKSADELTDDVESWLTEGAHDGD